MGVHRSLPGWWALLAFAVCSIGVSVHAAGRIDIEDRLARRRYEHLVKRSATMREMVSVIGATPGLVVRVRGVFGSRDSSGHIAQGILRLGGDGIEAVLEFDIVYSPLSAQLEMLAHELAHVIEVVCLPSIATQGNVRGVLLARGFSTERSPSGRVAIETPFARDVGHRVLVEAMTGAREAGALRSMARQYGLGAPCSGIESPALPPATVSSK